MTLFEDLTQNNADKEMFEEFTNKIETKLEGIKDGLQQESIITMLDKVREASQGHDEFISKITTKLDKYYGEVEISLGHAHKQLRLLDRTWSKHMTPLFELASRQGSKPITDKKLQSQVSILGQDGLEEV